MRWPAMLQQPWKEGHGHGQEQQAHSVTPAKQDNRQDCVPKHAEDGSGGGGAWVRVLLHMTGLDILRMKDKQQKGK